jgi:hypothetical protein
MGILRADQGYLENSGRREIFGQESLAQDTNFQAPGR